MTALVSLLALSALPLLGLAVSRWILPPGLSGPARAASLTAAGAVLLSFEMLLFDVLGLKWSVPILLAPAIFAPLGLAPLFRQKGRPAGPNSRDNPGAPAPLALKFALVVPARKGALVIAAVEVAIAAFLASTARATLNDYIYFWGTKGELFARARGIDQQILRYVHSDYPPLVPFLYAWGSMAAGGFSWMAGPIYLPIFLGLSAASFWGLARGTMPSQKAAELTAVLTGLLGYGLTFNVVGGGAEAPLLFFETLALAALALRSDADRIAGIALAGAILTKSEGTAFAFLAITVFGFVRLREGRLARFLRDAALLPIVAQASWYLYCRSHGLLRWFDPQTVSTVRVGLFPGVAWTMLASVGFRALYAPWIIVAILLVSASGPPTRGGIAAAALAAGFVLFLSFIYMHGEQVPVWMIRWSASRALLAVLLCLFFTGATGALAPTIESADR